MWFPNRCFCPNVQRSMKKTDISLKITDQIVTYFCINVRSPLSDDPSLPAMAAFMAPLLANSCMTPTVISGFLLLRTCWRRSENSKISKMITVTEKLIQEGHESPESLTWGIWINTLCKYVKDRIEVQKSICEGNSENWLTAFKHCWSVLVNRYWIIIQEPLTSDRLMRHTERIQRSYKGQVLQRFLPIWYYKI